VLGASFQSAADREWLRLFVESVDDESRKFYHEYWLSESRARAGPSRASTRSGSGPGGRRFHDS
jgi:hypothetical protein